MVKSSARTAAAFADGPAHGARHVAIIMDGNGRWAKRHHLPRAMGHQRGSRRCAGWCAGSGRWASNA
jgi:undecaprenyl pyrophosphate synthase